MTSLETKAITRAMRLIEQAKSLVVSVQGSGYSAKQRVRMTEGGNKKLTEAWEWLDATNEQP